MFARPGAATAYEGRTTYAPLVDKPRSSIDADSASTLLFNPNKSLPLQQQRERLPIRKCREHILYCVETYQVVILVSDTGSGKSTQIPQYLYEAGWTSNGKGVVCTQPRRMAAVTVSGRVAKEMGVSLGEEVGYSIRFDNQSSKERTVVKYCTDGSLVRELMADPLLSAYNVVMVDEAHERTLHSDVLLGLLKKIKRRRRDLRIIVTSATLNAQALFEFFNEKGKKAAAPSPEGAADDTYILTVQGRSHPVDMLYLSKPCINYLRSALDTVLAIHEQEGPGDVLVFLPGGEEIDSAIELLAEMHSRAELCCLPLYSALPVHEQMRVFEPVPRGQRKVVFATNIAETSVTIENIKFVVDCGFVKMNYFDFHSNVESLVTCSIAQSSGSQRAGRAGRTSPGKCFRLCMEKDYLKLPEFAPAEIQRTDISAAVLQLKALGIDDVLHFNFPSPPSAEAMIYALELLYSLGALDGACKLTRVGEKMAEMPVEPRLARCLLHSLDSRCSEEILSVAAMCAVDYPFISQRGRASQEAKQRLAECVGEFVKKEGDHMTLLGIYNGFIDNASSSSWCDSKCLQSRVLIRAKEVRNHLKVMLKTFTASAGSSNSGMSSCGADDSVTIRKCILAGYFSNIARLAPDGRYSTIRGGKAVDIHHSSVFQRFVGTLPPWVVFDSVVGVDGKCAVREVSAIDAGWVVALAPHYYEIR